MRNETCYARSGDISIAYQVQGEGAADLLIVPGLVSHVESFHDLPGYGRLLARLGRFARVITFDKRGNGLSDRVVEAPSLYERMDDVRAVLDAAGSQQAVVLGVSEGSAMSVLFAAEHPERTAGLILFGGFPRMLAAPGYEIGMSPEQYEQFTEGTVADWGTGSALLRLFGPSLATAESSVRAIAARCERMSATPTALRALWRMNASIDVRDVLPGVRVPTLVLHRRDDRVVPIEAGRYLAAHIPGATLVELDGEDHFPFVGDIEAVVNGMTPMFELVCPDIPTPLVGSTTEQDHTTTRPTSSSDSFEPAMLGLLSAHAELDQPVELGRFVVERSLGSGGMGSVFLARDLDLGRQVALKLLHTRDADGFRRFRREAMAIARLSHPNVVQIYELGLDAPVPYLVMEYMAGGTAAQLVAQKMPWERASRIIASAARGLGAAHAVGIVHRDVKPANLLLPDPRSYFVKVADFGVAKLSGAEPLTQEGALVGTIGYLAPEQAAGKPIDARADVYALAVTWYRLLTGRAPFSGTPGEVLAAALRVPVPDPARVEPRVPAPIAALVQRMGALSANDRPVDGNAAAHEIESAVDAAIRAGGAGSGAST
jgi:pimeloyl-ACP methyl ester carboxylesterase